MARTGRRPRSKPSGRPLPLEVVPPGPRAPEPIWRMPLGNDPFWPDPPPVPPPPGGLPRPRRDPDARSGRDERTGRDAGSGRDHSSAGDSSAAGLARATLIILSLIAVGLALIAFLPNPSS